MIEKQIVSRMCVCVLDPGVSDSVDHNGNNGFVVG